ncbi:MAG TPA: PD-(D/E)XK nuclease family protein [Polyangiaceae bacterium]
MAHPSTRELFLVPSEWHVDEDTARGARAVSLTNLLERLATQVSPRAAASPQAVWLATRRALGAQSALADAMDRAIGGLRRAGTPREALAKLADPRAKLIGEVWQRLEDELAAASLRDPRSNAALARAASLAEVPEFEGISRVRVRGVIRFENDLLAWLLAVHATLRARGGEGVAIELPPHDADVSALATRFERHWLEENDHPTLEFATATAHDGPILVVEAAHEASEARAAVRAVLDALANGAALDRIVLVLSELDESFLEPLRSELSTAGIAWSEPKGRPIGSAAEAHAVLDLLRLARGPIARDALVDLLRMPGLELSALGADPHAGRHFIEQIAEIPLGVDRSGEELLQALNAQLELAKSEHERSSIEVACTVVSNLSARLAALHSKGTRRAARRGWLELFAELGLLTSDARTLARAFAMHPAALRALGDNARAARALETAFAQVVEAAATLGLDDELVSPDEFADELAAALERASAPVGGRHGGTLRIARPLEIAALDLDLVVVCRAASSSLDWGSAREGLLTRDLGLRLPERERPLDSRDGTELVRIALSSALARARARVVTWAKRDASGSSGVSRFVSALPDTLQYREPASPLDPAARRTTSLRPASENAKARAHVELARIQYYSRPGQEPDAFNGRSGPLAGLVPADADRPLALTQLERYARCAFQGFAAIVLRAVRDEEVSEGPSVRERGILVHNALAHALSGLARRSHAERPQLLELASERARAFLFAGPMTPLRRATLLGVLSDVNALLRWSFEQADDCWFREAERPFGADLAWKPLEVGGHFVSGRIDRIDASADGKRVRVIDYKTGGKPAGDEQALQRVLYARKVAIEYGAMETRSGYLTLNQRAPQFTPKSDEPLSELEIAQKSAQAAALIDDLQAGLVPPQPAQASLCTRCDARDICRRPLSAPSEEEP